MAARKEATVPTSQSSGSAPAEERLKRKQPRGSPHTASDVKRANTHSASESRNWITLEVVPGRSRFCR